MRHIPQEPERVNTDTARRLLERATALEKDGPTLVQLREAAAEAGISNQAFDAAVLEWRAQDALHAHESPSPTSSRVRRIGTALIRNAAALGAGVATAAVLFNVSEVLMRGAPDQWLLEKLAAPVALGAMAYVTSRFRARVLTTLTGGLALSQAVEFVLDFFNRAPAVRGFTPHMALIIGGIAVAVVFEVARTRSRGAGTPTSADPANVGAEDARPRRGAWFLVPYSSPTT